MTHLEDSEIISLFYEIGHIFMERLEDLYDFDDESLFKTALSEADILVNGTSVGMSPKVDACIIKDEYFKDSSSEEA